MYIRHNFSILDTKIVGELCLALAEEAPAENAAAVRD